MTPGFTRLGLRALASFRPLVEEFQSDLPEFIDFCSYEGALSNEIEQFIRSIEVLLKRRFGLFGWQTETRNSAEEEEGALCFDLRLFPPQCNLSGVGDISFSIYWYNPYAAEPTDRDLTISVHTPLHWPHRDGLKRIIKPKLVKEDFTD